MNKRLFKILTFLLVAIIPITLVGCKKKGGGDSDTKKQITSISLSTISKTRFFVDDTLDFTGFKIKVFYDDSSSSEVNVTSDMVAGFDSSTTGSRTMTITYAGKTCEVEYIVVNPSATKITLISPFETEYFQNDEVNTSGGIIKVEFDKGEPVNVPVTPNMISDYDNLVVGTRNLKITYLGVSIEVEYTIKKLEITQITVASSFKTSYFVGETLSVDGGKLNVKYNSNKTTQVEITKSMVSDFDSSTSGTKFMTITYEGKTTQVQYIITDIVLTKIELDSSFKTEYFVGETLDISGGKIKLTYNNGDTEEINITKEMISQFSTEEPTEKNLTITYNSKTCEVQYKVIAIIASKIEISHSFKTSYFVGDEIVIDGGKILVTYNNKSTEELNITIDMVSGFSSLASGEFMLTITHLGLTTTVEYVIEEPQIVEITLKTDFKRLYYVGESKDYTGGEIRVNYSNGTYKDVLLTSLKPTAIKGFSTAKAGTDKDLTITYDGFPLTLSYDVYTLSFVIKTTFKTEYSLNEELDITGGTLLVTFGDKETPEEIAITADMITKFDTSTAGTYYLTITYRGTKMTDVMYTVE